MPLYESGNFSFMGESMNDTLVFLQQLAQLNFPRSYLGKLMMVAFLGVHIPLLSIVLYASLLYLTYFAG